MKLRRQTSPSESTSAGRFLVVGLGNPGKQYAHTRHNVGQDAIELLASRLASPLKKAKQRALISETRISGQPTILAVPITYMNDSGDAVGPLVRHFKIDDLARVIIVHDELDLEPGIVRVKLGGGLAGHNGLRSISQHLKSDDYVRVRIGVGKPRSKDHGADHVLNKLAASERKILDVSIETAIDAVNLIISDGLAVAMQRVNAK